MNWNEISEELDLDITFMKEHRYQLNWATIARTRPLAVSFIEEMEDVMNWYSVSRYQDIDNDFVHKYVKNLYFSGLQKNEYFTSFYNTEEDVLQYYEEIIDSYVTIRVEEKRKNKNEKDDEYIGQIQFKKEFENVRKYTSNYHMHFRMQIHEDIQNVVSFYVIITNKMTGEEIELKTFDICTSEEEEHVLKQRVLWSLHDLGYKKKAILL